MGLLKGFSLVSVLWLVAMTLTQGYQPGRSFGQIAGSRWGSLRGASLTETESPLVTMQPLETLLVPGGVVDITSKTFAVLGEYNELGGSSMNEDFESMKRRHEFNLRVGSAMEVLRRELPLVFALSNLDFSIFAASITVVDQRQNKVVMPKSLYMAAVKSVRMASAISSMYPCMNVKKIEYVAEEKTIQCLVDVVLPDAVRIDGQAMWEGMFYFGLDDEGLINSHVFDRKVSNFQPSRMQAAVANLPWLRSTPTWTPELVPPVPVYAAESVDP